MCSLKLLDQSANTCLAVSGLNPTVMMDYESSSSPSPLEDGLLTDSENPENQDDDEEEELTKELLQVNATH